MVTKLEGRSFDAIADKENLYSWGSYQSKLRGNLREWNGMEPGAIEKVQLDLDLVCKRPEFGFKFSEMVGIPHVGYKDRSYNILSMSLQE